MRKRRFVPIDKVSWNREVALVRGELLEGGSAGLVGADIRGAECYVGPPGADGKTPAVVVAGTTTLDSGAAAAVGSTTTLAVDGTPTVSLSFAIPQGPKGDPGEDSDPNAVAQAIVTSNNALNSLRQGLATANTVFGLGGHLATDAAVSGVVAQAVLASKADWAEADPSALSFIKNKPSIVPSNFEAWRTRLTDMPAGYMDKPGSIYNGFTHQSCNLTTEALPPGTYHMTITGKLFGGSGALITGSRSTDGYFLKIAVTAGSGAGRTIKSRFCFHVANTATYNYDIGGGSGTIYIPPFMDATASRSGTAGGGSGWAAITSYANCFVADYQYGNPNFGGQCGMFATGVFVCEGADTIPQLYVGRGYDNVPYPAVYTDLLVTYTRVA